MPIAQSDRHFSQQQMMLSSVFYLSFFPPRLTEPRRYEKHHLFRQDKRANKKGWSPYSDQPQTFQLMDITSEQLVTLAVIHNRRTHIMHRIFGWLGAIDEVLLTGVATAIGQLAGAAVDSHCDHAIRRG